MEQEPTWNEILGSKNWDNILDPLDLTLRKLILRCGDFCQASYDAFNNDKNSMFCGTSRYGKSTFFQKVMSEESDNFYVHSFLYATARVSVPEAMLLKSHSRESWDRESNWIGFIAVSSDEYAFSVGRREVYVVFRGTTRNYEWVDIMGAKKESATSLLRRSSYYKVLENPNNKDVFDTDSDHSSDDDGENDSKHHQHRTPKVMRGWLTIYVSNDPRSLFTKESVRSQILIKINEIRDRYHGEATSVIFTGHSLGAVLSILGAFDVVENGVTDIPVAAFVFGSPHIGNRAFNNRLNMYPNLKVLHIKNKIDVIPHYPGRLFGYVHTGTEFIIDTRKSNYLKDSKNPSDWHNLQAMLHVVAGWNGEKGEFKLRVKRSIALVNKSSEYLKDECFVPGSWWVDRNRGMVRGEDGEWALAPPDEEDLPVPEF